MAYQISSVELDMVNDVLYNTGESLVNSLEGGPNISQIRFALEREKKRLLSNEGFGWTWNTIDLKLTPDVNGEYRVSPLVLDLVTDKPTYRVVQGVLRDMKTGETTNLDVHGIQGTINLAFEDLPVSAQHYLSTYVSYREAVSQAFSQNEREELLQLSFQHLNELREQEIYAVQSDGSHTRLDNSIIFDPLTRWDNMSRT